MAEKTTELEIREDVAYITLQSPPLNILTAAMMDELTHTVEELGQNAEIKAVVVRANGKAFSAGADVDEHRPEQAPEMIGAFSKMFEAFWALEVPVVMAVGGAALGGGFELVMMADVLLATPRAKFGQPEILLGFFAPVGVAYLPDRVGQARAMEITCAGRTYDAETMHRWGFVSEIVADGELDEAVERVCKGFRKVSPLILRMNVRMIKRLRFKHFPQAHQEAEKVFLEELMKTEDVQEGIASFNEKRKPVWKNR